MKTQANQHGLRKANWALLLLPPALGTSRGWPYPSPKVETLRVSNHPDRGELPVVCTLRVPGPEEGYGHAVTRRAMPLAADCSKSFNPMVAPSPGCHVPSHDPVLGGSDVAF